MTQDLKWRLQTRNFFSEKIRFFAVFALMILSFSSLMAEMPNFFNLGSGGTSNRGLFIQSARKYLGVPYVRGGTTPEGMDCSGLIFRATLDAFGEEVPRTVSALSARCDRITDHAREPGDLLFFNTTGRISHVGIYLGGGTFIHAASDGPRTGVIVSDLSEDYWRRNYRYAGRILLAEDVKVPEQGKDRAPAVNPFPFGGEIGFRLNYTGGILWDLGQGEGPLRGASANAEAVWMKGLSVWPGLGTGLCWDTRSDSVSIPLTASLSTAQGFRFFIGTQLHLTAADDLNRKPQFPGLIGLSWNSKPVTVAGQKMRFYQSAEYSWFNDETFHSGLRFNTGLTFSFDI